MALGLPEAISACLFDLDGVLTRTAVLHDAAWKQAFDELLAERAGDAHEVPVPFDAVKDYDDYVDGRPRLDGTRTFLRSRGIELPDGTPGDKPGSQTLYGVANRKNELVLQMMKTRGVEVYPGSRRFLEEVRRISLKTAVVSSSENAATVLKAAGLEDLLDARVDGVVAMDAHLAGKPAPDTYLEAARRLEVAPREAAVFEDAIAGVEAGRAGGFGFVVGVDRVGQREQLAAHGADVVVADLSDLIEP
jgi:beta-phosphoglucomutase family hydrolase